jgi:hypothetical protein
MREHLTILENDLCDARELLYIVVQTGSEKAEYQLASKIACALERIRKLRRCIELSPASADANAVEDPFLTGNLPS